MKVFISLLLALLVSGAGYWFKALDFSGFLAAALVGASIFWGAGLPGAGALIFFFVLGSVLSRLPSGVLAPEQKARRDGRQVLANGFWPALLALGYGWNGDETYYLALVGALAAACADTASGEAGIRWGKKTVSLRNLRAVFPGQSGGISAAGTLAGLAAAVMLGMVAIFPRNWDLTLSLKLTGLVAAVGFCGSLFDSLLGAWLQGKYLCLVCRSAVEVPRHCDRRAERLSGLGFLDNDGVNFLSTLFGGGLGLVLF